jgi:hypothetical protein
MVVVYSGSAIITPAEPVFIEIFGVSAEVSSLVLSMYVLGYVGCHDPCAGKNNSQFLGSWAFIFQSAVGNATDGKEYSIFCIFDTFHHHHRCNKPSFELPRAGCSPLYPGSSRWSCPGNWRSFCRRSLVIPQDPIWSSILGCCCFGTSSSWSIAVWILCAVELLEMVYV